MAEPNQQTDQSTVKEEKKDLVEAAKRLPPTETFSLRPRNFEEAYRFANLIAESDMIPKEFQKKPANVLLAVQLGMELGVSPMQALQSTYVVNGRPTIYGDLLPALIHNSGLLEYMREEGDEQSATCTVKRKGHEEISRTFTMKDAERAKLPERNPTYKTYPKRMLQMRSRAFAIRDAFPDVLKGVAIREEVEDIEIYAEPETQERTAIARPQRASEAAKTDHQAPAETKAESISEADFPADDQIVDETAKVAAEAGVKTEEKPVVQQAEQQLNLKNKGK